MIHFAYGWLYWFVLPSFIGILAYRVWRYKPVVYKYSLVQWLSKQTRVGLLPAYVLWILRFSLLSLLLFLVGKPQLVDQKSTISTEGIDIIIALDASGSMRLIDDMQDRRTRFSVAQAEAKNFVENRTNDQVGLVLFGKQAIARCPLTLDHTMLQNLITDFKFNDYGEDFHNGTMCGQALLSCARRLQKSKAKSKVVILLTDGQPTDPDLIPAALKILKKFDIKVYTIAVGNSKGSAYFQHPHHGLVRVQAESANIRLLEYVASQTGGKMFQAHKPRDLKRAYQTIDTLEKTVQESNIYQQYTDYFRPFLWPAAGLAVLELLLTTCVWCIV